MPNTRSCFLATLRTPWRRAAEQRPAKAGATRRTAQRGRGGETIELDVNQPTSTNISK